VARRSREAGAARRRSAAGGGAGGRARVDDTLYIVGSDGRLLRAAVGGGSVTAIGDRFDPVPSAIVAVEGGLALLAGAAITIVDRDGKPRHPLALPADGTALAASPDGRRLAAGTARGDVLAFGAEDDGGFVQSDAQKIHDGAVIALLFDGSGATFLSTGVDRKLVTCHARGALEAEDRAGSNMHDAPVPVMVRVERDDDSRLYTAGRDGQIKTWAPGKKRPKTWKDGVARPVAAAHLTLRKRPHLAVAGDDNIIRLFLLDADGQVVDRPVTIQDAYAAAREAFADASPVRRQTAIGEIAALDDGLAVGLLLDRAERDPDAELRVRAVEALGRSKSPKSLQPLENLLRNARPAVRAAALAGLRARVGERDRRPLELALASGHADIGVAAVEALLKLAGDDDQALARLTAALDDATREVRLAAFDALETLHGHDNPNAAIRALASTHADVRTAALLRFHRRELLDRARVASAIRRASGDSDAGVRQTAFHVAVLSRPTLAAALRYLDRDLHRHLHEIEQPAQPEQPAGEAGEADEGARVEVTSAPPAKGKKARGKAAASAEAAPADKPDGKLPRPKKVTADAVDEADRRPLLEAMASRALDTCVRGALHLARLGDGRAFGTLLQLSRESDIPTRVDACRALADLGDPRSHGRLRQMLRDDHPSVRDAAFTALADLLGTAPLDAADAGLLAAHEDVRRRGLNHLVAHIRKSPPPAADARSARLIERALNDSEAAVRGEAFKALVNLQLFGGGAATLSFALRSLHASVRREVLTEVMGEIAEPWAQDLLPTLFDDPDPGLRREAFDFARKRSKGRDVAPLARALVSPHADLRLEAAQTLARKSKGAEMRTLLVTALDDPDRAVRITAIDALEAAEAHAAVATAMASPHADVRVRAAEARAVDGDAAALAPLIAQVRTPRPEVSDLQGEWRDLTVRALRGIAALADPHAAADLTPLIDGPDADVRVAAAEALGWSVPSGDPAALHVALRHADAAVRLAAAIALARLGDATGASIVFAPPPAAARNRRPAATGPVPSPAEALEAAVALDARDVFLSFLDHADDTLRERALRVLLLQDMADGDGVPDRCLAALSSSQGRTRLAAADALARFNDPDAFAAFVRLRLTGTDDDPSVTKVDRTVVADLGQMLAHGGPRLRARAVALIARLDVEDKEKRDFHRAWRRFAERFGDALTALRETAGRRTPAAPIYTDVALRELVFGAYVGLSRLGGGQAESRIRQTALTRLAEGGAPLASLAPVLIQALGDPAQTVRAQAFAALQGLRLPAADLAAEALGTGRRDIGVLGLQLLAAEAGAAGDEVLRDVIAHDTDGLAGEATRLLGERRTPAEAWILALEARDAELRGAAVGRLAELADADARALAGLRGALDSRFVEIRFAAAVRLAYKGDAAAFDPLVKSLRTDRQRAAIEPLVRLGDPRTAMALLDRIENDPAGDADVSALHDALARLRDEAAVDRLIAQLADPNRRRGAFEALRRITGFDQSIDVDLDDEAAREVDDRRWLAEQHPAARGGVGAGDRGAVWHRRHAVAAAGARRQRALQR
jgi:ParB family chromosome partitioning protein